MILNTANNWRTNPPMKIRWGHERRKEGTTTSSSFIVSSYVQYLLRTRTSSSPAVSSSFEWMTRGDDESFSLFSLWKCVSPYRSRLSFSLAPFPLLSTQLAMCVDNKKRRKEGMADHYPFNLALARSFARSLVFERGDFWEKKTSKKVSNLVSFFLSFFP